MPKGRRSWLLLHTVLLAVLSLWMAARVRTSPGYVAERKYPNSKKGWLLKR